ncbi:MAG: dUTPase [Bacillota bacterium]|jgi:dimeric dUTPase (all-alpha-NTP-PPase superfamily)|nr:dUTPase [Bacillota bacterium]HHU43267.1 dUTPase [Clostridiales bacterium]
MDRLQELFDMQRKFDLEVVEKRNLHNITPDEWMQKETLAMISELSELLDEVNFKWWKNPKTVDYQRVKEELIDIFHFFMSMCLKIGMDADEVYQRYIEKNKENFKRQQGLSQKRGYAVSELNKE